MIKLLKENQHIIIRKADKSNTIVIMDKSKYKNKINDIISDESKFHKIDKDPTYELKVEINKLIDIVNNIYAPNLLTKLTGHF